ncbi:hypothetical protein MNBD_CHLOROFLEXI01-5071 [hydrothermal vent metagenome]|uniref:Uncharacterized protein n=1 Tax=hydrothermal vent metagenome TaxID=652676 RepID=A0A3B0VG35_9ZZZZ
MTDLYITTATLTNKKNLILDEALPLVSGRVRVTIEELPKIQMAASSFLAKLQAIHQALEDSGYRPRSKEVIDAQIRAERDSWGE